MTDTPSMFDMRSRLVAGADAARAGWVVALADIETAEVRVIRAASLDRIAPHGPISLLAVDMPVGLPDFASAGGRLCDRLVRRTIPQRASSVFSPPSRPALEAWRAGASYRATSAANAVGPDRVGLSKQSFNILPRIDEVDRLARSSPPDVVAEVFPELSFARAAGRAPTFSKHSVEGIAERVDILDAIGMRAHRAALDELVGRGVSRADVVDACIVCWSARRIARGEAESLPNQVERDAHGLAMRVTV